MEPYEKKYNEYQEAKDILQEVVNWKYDSLRGHPSINSIAEAAEIILQSNLSTDINEAAEEWFKYAKYKSDLSCAPINAFKAGAEWRQNNLWKSADGDDLPEIDREVVVLYQRYPLEGNEYAVGFAHRPREFWDGKNIATGEVTRYYPKRYDRGGWNSPNIKWWLDLDLPKKEE